MSAAAYARRYCEIGFALTWSPPGQKGPRHAGWNLPANAIRDPQRAFDFWRAHPDRGIGALLGPSGLVSLDVDHVAHTREILAAFRVDLDDLAATAPRIVGNPEKFRLVYRAPAELLAHRTLSWPQREDPRKGFAVFELRAGAVSDALPPTIHVGTGKPYRWATPPRAGFPALPAALLELWLAWPRFEREARALCPWAPPPPPARSRTHCASRATGESVIAKFNEAHDAAAILEAHGYRRQGRRFASPDTKHAAGVVMLESGKVFCHHAGDPLGGGKALDAFDLYARLEHGGDVRAAVRSAAQALGLGNRSAAA